MNDIKIDADAMTAIVSKAILEGIDADQKQAILQQAVDSLLKPYKVDRYGSETTTPLQAAFSTAVQQTVGQVAREMVSENQELLAKVRELVTQAMADAVKEPYTKLRENINRAVADSIVSGY